VICGKGEVKIRGKSMRISTRRHTMVKKILPVIFAFCFAEGKCFPASAHEKEKKKKEEKVSKIVSIVIEEQMKHREGKTHRQKRRSTCTGELVTLSQKVDNNEA
jgi:hypothetical protein